MATALLVAACAVPLTIRPVPTDAFALKARSLTCSCDVLMTFCLPEQRPLPYSHCRWFTNSLHGFRQEQHRAQPHRGLAQVFLRSPEHGAGGQGEVLVYACSWWSAAEVRSCLSHTHTVLPAWRKVQHRQQCVRHGLEPVPARMAQACSARLQ